MGFVKRDATEVAEERDLAHLLGHPSIGRFLDIFSENPGRPSAWATPRPGESSEMKLALSENQQGCGQGEAIADMLSLRHAREVNIRKHLQYKGNA